MNRKYLNYRLGKSFHDYLEIPYSALTIVGVEIAKVNISQLYNPDILTKISCGMASAGGIFVAAVSGFTIFTELLLRYGERWYKKEISSDMEKYPFEFVRRIEFESDDRDILLDETLTPHRAEWMTVHVAHVEDGVAFIDEVLDPMEALEMGLYKRGRITGTFQLKPSKEVGTYDGFTHCHTNRLLSTIFPGQDYSISRSDRIHYFNDKFINKINFLTFIEGIEPKIVGYNISNIYLPKYGFSHVQPLVLEKVTEEEIREGLLAGTI